MSIHPKPSDTKDSLVDVLAHDLMDLGMRVDDEMVDYSLETDCGKRNMPSPLTINSHEILQGAYVPLTSTTAVQPNVGLSSGSPYGDEATMTYGNYLGHPNDSAATTPAANHDRPWKLVALDVSVKVPYLQMQICVSDIPHWYLDPRLRGGGNPSCGGNPGMETDY